MHTGTARQPFCFHWLTSQAGDQWNCLKQDRMVLLFTAIPYTVVLAMDPHLVEDTIFTLPATPHPAQILTQTLDTPTAHQLVTVLAPYLPDHSWQEATIFNLMRLKYFMKILELKRTNWRSNSSVWIIGRIEMLKRYVTVLYYQIIRTVIGY